MRKAVNDESVKNEQKRIDDLLTEINESLMRRYKFLCEEEDRFRDGE